MTFDKILLSLGSPGRYQLLAGFLLCCIQLPASFTDHLMQLYSAAPPHRCRIHFLNTSVIGESEYRPLVEKQGKKFYSSCSMYTNPEDHSDGTQPCVDGWQFLTVEDEWTLVTEWNLVCEREYLIQLLPYVYHVGAMIGAIIFGLLADYYGRKCPLLIALVAHTALGIALHFLPSFTLFATVYSLQGIFVTGIQSLSYILLLETVSFPFHLRAAVLLSSFWTIGVLVLSVLSWLIQNWRYIQVAVSAPGIVCIGYFWLLPQSLPWLLTEGKLNEAEAHVLRFSRFNKTPLPQNFRLQLRNFAKAIKGFVRPSGSRHSFETVICSAKIRRFTFILYYIWVVLYLASNATDAEVPALHENPYARLFVKGIMDLGMIIILYFFSTRFGAKCMQSSLLVIGGLLCIGSASLGYQTLFYLEPEGKLKLLSPVFTVIGKAAIRSTAATNFFFSIKTFPTGVRAIGLGSCLFWARCSNLIGPQLDTLASETGDFFPLALCGVLSVIGGGLTIFLPKSCLRPLPNVAREVEKSMVVNGAKQQHKVHFSKQSAAVLTTMEPSPVQCVIHHSNPSPAEDDNEKNSRALLELSVQDIETFRVRDTVDPHRQSISSFFDDCVAGPSNVNVHMAPPSEVDKEDTESRLTDLEEELAKIWDLKNTPHRSGCHYHEGGNILSTDNSLHEFHDHRRDLREYFGKMNETSF